jgi:hypothetical protein
MSALAALLACPLCAQQAQSPFSSLLVAVFLAVPFAISALVILSIRNSDS